MNKKSTPLIFTSSFLLQVVLFLEKNHSAKEAASHFGLTKQAFNYHLKKLRLIDIVYKKGYGVWGVKRENLNNLDKKQTKVLTTSKKEVKKTAPTRYKHSEGGAPQTSKNFAVVSGHAYLFVLKLPCLVRWDCFSRRNYLLSRGVGFQVIPQGESLDVDLFSGWRVWLCSKKVVFYAPAGRRYVSSDEYLSFRQAFLDCVVQVRRLEKILGVSLRVSGDYWLKTRREHNAHVDRVVAKEAVRGGKKFAVWDEVGIWLRVDCSTGVPEMESEASGSEARIEAVRDASRLVREDFNTLKDKGITRQFLLEQDARIQDKLERYADNIDSHVRVMKRIETFLKRIEERWD